MMTPLQKKVKEKTANARKVKKNTSNPYHPFNMVFGDRYNSLTDSLGTTEVAYLLSKFPPCQMYKHSDSCTQYLPTEKKEKKTKHKTSK